MERVPTVAGRWCPPHLCLRVYLTEFMPRAAAKRTHKPEALCLSVFSFQEGTAAGHGLSCLGLNEPPQCASSAGQAGGVNPRGYFWVGLSEVVYLGDFSQVTWAAGMTEGMGAVVTTAQSSSSPQGERPW